MLRLGRHFRNRLNSANGLRIELQVFRKTTSYGHCVGWPLQRRGGNWKASCRVGTRPRAGVYWCGGTQARKGGSATTWFCNASPLRSGGPSRRYSSLSSQVSTNAVSKIICAALNMIFALSPLIGASQVEHRINMYTIEWIRKALIIGKMQRK